ncbi:alpha/beta hydrolase-fold protein [Ottowia thiooxydans]|uniref:Pimeloyl-ACP methyl ester carboxylesterase n=1 Tax=Ottowia thiooxydans TaxID=219182 RepID=A0ABV2QFN8_9BURK
MNDGDAMALPTSRRGFTAVLALAPWISSCALLPRPLKTPMDSQMERADPARRSDTLIVLLPGAYDTPQDFVDQGFVKALRERKLPVDLQLVDAHTGYYTAQQIVHRLHDEVVAPARAQGYKRIWMAGISLGGYGSLLFAREHSELIDGVFVMAPFLGRRDLPAAIHDAGGLGSWSGEMPNADAHDLALWRWLRAHAGSAGPRVPLYLGYGDSDRFAFSHKLLAAALPPQEVFVTPGGHQWAPWLVLWQRFLDLRPWE